MKKRFHAHLGTAVALGIRPTAAERRAGRLLRAPDHDGSTGGTGGNGDAEPTAEEKAAAEAAAAAAAAKEDGEPELKDLDAARTALKEANARAAQAEADAKKARDTADKFKGIDPEKARENAQKVKDAEATARQAELDKAKAEGNFERLRELQNEEHQAAVSVITSERDAAAERATQAEAKLATALRTSAFASSTFILNDTILGPVKAARLYGDHVEIEGDEVVVYDAPRGVAKRAKVMDARGNALPFDKAIQKVIEADPDKDAFLKNKTIPGAGSKSVDGKVAQPKDRLSRLASGLKALKEG